VARTALAPLTLARAFPSLARLPRPCYRVSFVAMKQDFAARAQVRARLDDELGTIYRQAPRRLALVYPSPYHVAMSSLGYQAMYRLLNARDEWVAERAFLPDDVRTARAPLCTYESGVPVGEHPVIAFSVAYELELTGLFDCLTLAGLPLFAAERDTRHPLVVAGGPLTFSNPLPLGAFVDVVVMGEAEELGPALLDAVAAEPDRQRLLDELAGRDGYWVPSRQGESLPRVARADAELPARSQVITPNTELRNMFLVEPERGCSRGCTYCVMRRSTNGGMRLVPPDVVLSLIPEAARRVGLVGAAVTDHPRIAEIVRRIVDSGREVGISSLRADRLTDELVGLLARGGYRTLTTASDGASERLRVEIERKTKEKHLVRAAELCRAHRMKQLKLYEMVGLPTETEADIDELVRFARELAQVVPLALGVAPFVAKRNTPLDGTPFAGIRVVEDRLERLRRGLQGAVEVRPTSARWAWVEYVLAQGGVEAGRRALTAHSEGGGFAAWKRAFADEEGWRRRQLRVVS
jgi:radical SAM superfamily enzyme YgiQ (UPF0313 family)